MWRPLLAEYLAAKARHREAEQLFHRSQRTFEKLARRLDDRRAYTLAGVNMADERSVRAYQVQRKAFQRLRSAIGRLGALERCMAIGAVMCAELPEAANDR
jgi:hypothetical protein